MTKILIDETTMKLTPDDVRKAGGIVHSDGNIFFTNIEKLNSCIGIKEQPAQQEPDLSELKPETQKQMREWLADGSFAERAIAALQDQERRLMAYEKVQQQEPCDMGSLCIGCNPRNIDGSCPGQKPNGACDCYVNGFNDGMKELEQPAQRTWVGI